MHRHLPENLRRLRKAAGLTQQGLAALAKLPRATVASIEHGQGSPRLDTVMAVADALQVGLDELVSPPPEHRYYKVSIAQAREFVDDHGRYLARLISPLASRGVQVQSVRLAPGCLAEGRPHPKGAQEFFFVHQGCAELLVDEEKVSVEAGALVQFPGHFPHVYSNPSKAVTVEAYSVVALRMGD